jgi:hypothetical protein
VRSCAIGNIERPPTLIPRSRATYTVIAAVSSRAPAEAPAAGSRAHLDVVTDCSTLLDVE